MNFVHKSQTFALDATDSFTFGLFSHRYSLGYVFPGMSTNSRGRRKIELSFTLDISMTDYLNRSISAFGLVSITK